MKLLADEDLNGNIVRGLVRRHPEIDLVRVQDIPELFEQDDRTVLEWAAVADRVIVSHDENTMTAHALDRLAESLPMSGLFIVPQSLSVGLAIEDLLLIDGCRVEGEWEGRILFLPLR